jgi:hypothetical protein
VFNLEPDMKIVVPCSALAAVLVATSAHATGLATCDSGPPEKWQRPSALEKKLTDLRWKVRRIRVDGGCYEVYAMNEKGERVEAYFHPVTLESVPLTGQRP